MLIAGPLGFAFDPSSIAKIGVGPPSAGAASSISAGAPLFTIQPHHFRAIYEEMNPGVLAINELCKTDPARCQAAAAQNAELWQQKVRSLAIGLPPCPSESVRDDSAGGIDCYHGRGAAYDAHNDPKDPFGLIAPGSFVSYGVTFDPSKIKDGKITRVFKPSPMQRKYVEHGIIAESLSRLSGDPNSAMNPNERFLVGKTDGVIFKSLEAKFGRGLSLDQAHGIMQNASVNEVLEWVPDIQLFWVSFERNPVQPHSNWFTLKGTATDVGGYYKWIASGGYPLSKSVLTGKSSLGGEFGLETCMSMLCACPTGTAADGRITGGRPSCLPGCVNKDGSISEKCAEANAGWLIYAAIRPDSLFEMTLSYQDPAVITKIGEKLAGWMTKLGMLFCGTAVPTAKSVMAKVKADICLDAGNKTCARGTAGCTCTSAPAASMESAQIATGVASKFCDAWLTEFTPEPPMPPPQFPPPLPTPKFKITPLMIALGVAAVGGAFLLTRKPVK